MSQFEARAAGQAAQELRALGKGYCMLSIHGLLHAVTPCAMLQGTANTCAISPLPYVLISCILAFTSDAYDRRCSSHYKYA